MPNTQLLTLPIEQYREIANIKMGLNLDFDNAYQYCVAKYYGAKIVTMDKDFEKAKNLKVLFL